MSLKDVSDEQLDEVAGYLDKHSDGHGSGSEEEFWRLLIKELKRATPASGGRRSDTAWSRLRISGLSC